MNRPASSRKRLPKRVWVAFFVILIVIMSGFAGIAWLAQPLSPWAGFQVPDEISAGRTLLLEKFTGPRYYQLNPVPEEGVPFPCLSVQNAQAQTPAIIAARQLSLENAVRIQPLILRLTRPASSLVIGLDFVNVLQLNLALDDMRINDDPQLSVKP